MEGEIIREIIQSHYFKQEQRIKRKVINKVMNE